MSENVRKLVGVVAMAALVVVGVAVSSGDDTNFTRNAAFMKLGDIKGDFQQLPKAQQARLAPKFLQQAAPKSNIWTTGPTTNYVPDGRNDGKVTIVSTGGAHGLSVGKTSVLEGKGVDGKGGQGLDIWTTGGTTRLVPKRIAEFRAGNGMNGVADRIEKLGFQQTRGLSDSGLSACNGKVVDSLKNVLVTSYTAEQATDEDHKDWVCSPSGDTLGGQEGEALKVFPKVEIHIAELLAECMESKVGDVFLKSHIEVSAADCVATVMPAISPKRAKQLGTYWQTQQQLGVWTNGNATSVWTNGNATSVWTNEE